MLSSIIQKLIANPRQIFLLDGVGALVSAAFLLGILVPFQAAFGMPEKNLYQLAGVASVFALYSMTCYFRISERWRSFLRVIAVCNTLYCLATAALVVYWYQSLTALGVLYFVLEMLVILALVSLEFKCLSASPQNSSKYSLLSTNKNASA